MLVRGKQWVQEKVCLDVVLETGLEGESGRDLVVGFLSCAEK